MTSLDGILFFLCLNDRGGAELSMVKLARGLAGRGQRVTLAVYGACPALAREQGFDGEVIDLGAASTARALWPLCRLLRRRRFTTVISALTHTNIAACLAAFLARSRAKIIVTEHGLDGVAACAASRLFSGLTRLCYARAVVVAVSRGLGQVWREIVPGHRTVITIYNPVVTDTPAPPSPPAHAWLRDKKSPVIMAIGRLKEEKNFGLLIRAFADVVADRDARLIILGEGEQRPLLEQAARERGIGDKILLPGFVDDLEAWLPYADLLVSASVREGFGNALVEALARGVPVVATDCPYGPAEILDNGAYGALVPMGDQAALAAAMVARLSQPVDASRLRARAGLFTAAHCVDAYLRVID